MEIIIPSAAIKCGYFTSETQMLISNLGFKIKKNKRMNCDLFEREWVCYLFCGSFLSLQRTFHMISLA